VYSSFFLHKLTGKYDASTAPQFIRAHTTVTRGNEVTLEKLVANMICANTTLLTA